MNLANWLTVIRIIFVPLVIIPLSINGLPHANYYALLAFLLLAFTDYLDGLAARKLKQETNLGKLLDPLADKILVISLLLFFISTNLIAYYWVAIIVIREFAVLGLRSLAALQNNVIKADIYGKAKTVWQYLTVSWLILGLPASKYFIWLMVLLTVLSGINYFWVNRKVLKNA